MAALGTIKGVYQTTDGKTFDNQEDAQAHQDDLNLRQEIAELVADTAFASSAAAVRDFLYKRREDIMLVLNGGDFEPAVVEPTA